MKVESNCWIVLSITISSRTRTYQDDTLAPLKDFLYYSPSMDIMVAALIKSMLVAGLSQTIVNAFDPYPEVVINAQCSPEREQAAPRTIKISIWTISRNYIGDIFHIGHNHLAIFFVRHHLRKSCIK